jgi:hypothetical protein
LNPNYQPTVDTKFDIGLVAHKLLLEGESVVEVVLADNWRTKAAQEQRDLARQHGRIPLLPADADKVEAMVAAVREQLATHTHSPPLFTDGTPEVTLAWEEDGVPARARIDWLHASTLVIDDLKTTTRSARAEEWSRRALFDHGCDIQAAWYMRGLQACCGVMAATWRWVVVETSPPYALSVITPGAAVLELANAKINRALEIWKWCLDTDEWPAYPPVLHVAELPAWEEARWLEREAMETLA